MPSARRAFYFMGAPFLYMLLANFAGGSSYLATVYALKGFSVVDSAFWRMGLAFLLFLPWLGRVRRAEISRRDWALIAGVGTVGYALPLLLGTLGLSHSTATHGVLLVGMEPVFIVLLAALFLKEPLTRIKVAAMALGIAGAALIVSQGRFEPLAAESPRVWGDLLLAATSALWALYTILGKPVLRRVDPLVFTTLTNMIAFVVIAAIALPGLSLGALSAAPAVAWAGLLYLAVANVLGPLAWNKGLAGMPASQTASFVFVQPLVGVLLGVLLGHEALTLWSAAGGALIVAGVYAASYETA